MWTLQAVWHGGAVWFWAVAGEVTAPHPPQRVARSAGRASRPEVYPRAAAWPVLEQLRRAWSLPEGPEPLRRELSLWLPDAPSEARRQGSRIRPFTVPALAVRTGPAVRLLASLPAQGGRGLHGVIASHGGCDSRGTRQAPQATGPLASSGPVEAADPRSGEVVAAPGVSVRFWSEAARFVLELAGGQHFLPDFVATHGAAPHSPADWQARWRPALLSGSQLERLRGFVRSMPPVCRAADPAASPVELFLDFLAAGLDAVVRIALQTVPLQAATARGTRLRPGAKAGIAFLQALRQEDGPIDFPPGTDALRRTLRAWMAPLVEGPEADFRTCFRLIPPGEDDREPDVAGPEAGRIVPGQGEALPAGSGSLRPRRSGKPRGTTDAPWTVRFYLQARDDPSLMVEAEQAWQQRSGVLHYLQRRWTNPQERLLADLGRASRLFPPLVRSLQEPCPSSCRLSTEEAYRFLREWAPLLEQSGFGVLVPSWWTKTPRLGLRLHARPVPSPSAARAGGLGRDSLVRFDWEVALGDERLPVDEFRRLARLKVPLVRLRGRWVELRPEQVEKVLALLERGRDRPVTLPEAARLVLGRAEDLDGTGSTGSPDGLPVVEIEASGDGPAAEVLKRLAALARASGAEGGLAGQAAAARNMTGPEDGQRPSILPPVGQPPGLEGQLRPYQLEGLAWLAWLEQVGLGACLADDMGLGKTVQLIALLLHERVSRGPDAEGGSAGRRADGVGPTLIVCPTSVVGNWFRELERFAPSLRVVVHHGARRLSGARLARAAARADVVLTTYALLHRDAASLQGVRWHRVVLDEAQNIKNPSALQSRAARALPAERRIAMTGTPVENRLSELWSIMEFLNPGYLGSAEGFRRRFAVPIERYGDRERAAALRRLVRPFILRRVKTDPRVVQELPEKMEMKVFCHLTREQATLYQAVVEEMLQALDGGVEGMARRGVVLAALSKLKQVCDHPALFLKDESPLDGRSGKLARLVEMLDEVVSAGDRALVFTQFASMGELIRRHIGARLGQPVLFLHGATPKRHRDEAVTRFQEGAAPVFVLSLKAGGVGLNLTAASHVFHFDRWWNPAVEDQATDRAFRIGQRRNVQVHKFVCLGTLEERIDELIERKKGLVQQVVGQGEQWITELSNDDLRALVTLSQEAVVELERGVGS